MISRTSNPKLHNQRSRTLWLTLGLLPRWVLYNPLAFLLAVLLLPEVFTMGATPPAVQAQAQIQVGGCASQTNSIIQNYCQDGLIDNVLVNALLKFENDSVAAYLAMHKLPATDAHFIYDTGRQDLRDEIRGVMMDVLKAIILKPASQRTAHEQTLYT
ncbi:MAG: hypothetical protein FJW31_18615 [Acidobacteria bacterium]|nr:hypothetical protein [Acidobacteriota bacterium]